MCTISVQWSTNILSYLEALLTKQLSEIHSRLKWFPKSVSSPWLILYTQYLEYLIIRTYYLSKTYNVYGLVE